MISDYHLHSSYSGDSQAVMEEQVKRAIELGMKTICFTEHIEFDFPYENTKDEPGMWDLATDSYLYELLRCKSKYEDDIEIYFGAEMGIAPDVGRKAAVYSHSYDFDFLIGSVHTINRMDPYYPQYWEGRSKEEAIREYFEVTHKSIRACGCFDVLGHLDYAIRYCKDKDQDYSYDKYKDVIDPVLQFLLDKEKGLEINTAGLRKGLKDCNPCTDIVKRYHELGGELITVGSDAHTVEDVGKDFDKAADLLRACGYEYYTVYEHRMPIQRKIR